MSEVLAGAVEWAARSGPPNAVFVVALLTSPALWGKRVKEWVKARWFN